MCCYRLLTGIKITNLETAKQAMNKLHEMGAKIVVISSTSLGSDDLLVCVGSSVNSKLITQYSSYCVYSWYFLR